MGERKRRILLRIAVVLFIAGAAGWYVVTELTYARHRSKQKRTMADMRTLATALEAWATDFRKYPVVTGVDALEPLLVPTYVKKLPRDDAWGRRFRYEASEEVYAITSAARDGLFEKSSMKDYKGGMVEDFDCDIVYSNGTFIQFPPGVGRN